jgi:hypothetical protein
VVLYRTFPQVFAGFLIRQSENKSMFLVVFHDHQGQLLLLEIQLGDLGPEEQANLGLALEHQDTSGG